MFRAAMRAARGNDSGPDGSGNDGGYSAAQIME